VRFLPCAELFRVLTGNPRSFRQVRRNGLLGAARIRRAREKFCHGTHHRHPQ